jgi:hypothetical protein
MITDPQALVSPYEPPASPSGRRVIIVDRSAGAFLASAGVLIVAGGAAAAVNSAAPFGHGSWLAAYLVLVGGVSQVVLGIGSLALHPQNPGRRMRRGQIVLWNLGSVTVPAGVLTDAPTLVTIGSIALLGALMLFATGARGRRDGVRGRTVVYLTIVVGLAVSVVVGSALADAAPGAWL